MPVLPATWPSATAPAWPVPDLTTSIMILRISSAVSGEITVTLVASDFSALSLTSEVGERTPLLAIV